MFTASVVKKDKGCFAAYAKEFPIVAQPASTQRGAIKKLKSAVLLRLQKAAESGTLADLLYDSGYPAELIGLQNIKLQPNIYDSHAVSVPLTRQLSRLNRAKRRATGYERNQS